MNTWNDIERGSIADLQHLDYINSRKESVWRNICCQAGIEQKEIPLQPTPVRHNPMWWLMRGAAAILAVLSIGYVAYTWRLSSSSHDNNSYATHITADTDHQQYIMPDNSVVTLAKGSTLAYTFNESQRSATVVGLADFKVVRDVERPFSVDLKESHVVVLGTEFTVENIPERARSGVNVRSGHVRFESRDGQMVELYKGDNATFSNGKFSTYHNSPDSDVSWFDQTLTLKDATLSQTLCRLQVVYPEITSVEENCEGIIESADNIRVTTRFVNTPLNQAIDELSLHFGIKIDFISGCLVLSR
ncbi:MAG: FecR domain-containing protein [Marinilabiliaceae bacterium]|nr:FecR domain-containing protein [Marinilabiliaceae bacterium]